LVITGGVRNTERNCLKMGGGAGSQALLDLEVHYNLDEIKEKRSEPIRLSEWRDVDCGGGGVKGGWGVGGRVRDKGRGELGRGWGGGGTWGEEGEAEGDRWSGGGGGGEGGERRRGGGDKGRGGEGPGGEAGGGRGVGE